MRKFSFLLILSLCACVPAFADITFIEDDLRAAKEQAAREGKLIFLDFWASYCTPCKVMEEYTFTNPSVSAYVNSNYIPVKVDVQSFAGFELKNQFDVTMLPTIIVLNSKGEVVGKHEETMGATKFISTLKSYDSPQNRFKKSGASNTNYNATTGYSNAKPIAISHKTNTRTAAESKSVTPSVKTNFKAVSSENVGAGVFTIQAGAFFTEASGKSAAKTIKHKYGQGQRIFMSQRDEKNKMIYRILVGQFSTRQEATTFMKTHKIQGLVRDFEAFK